MHGTDLHIPGPHLKIQRMSTGLVVLPEEVKMKARYADALSICGRTKSRQSSLHVGEDFLRLVFGCLRKRGERSGLTLHGSCADFIEDAIHSHRAEQIGIRRLLN